MKSLIFFLISLSVLYGNDDNANINNIKNLIGKQIRIAKGYYYIGSNKERDNKPLRKVFFKEFCIDVFPVTNKEYSEFIRKSGYKPKGGFSVVKGEKAPYHPATELTYEDALKYAKSKNMRLPTEWEWEIAARSLKKDIVYVSINLTHKKRGHFISDREYYNKPVFSYPPNELGLYQMTGNVYEWTSSKYDDEFLYGKYKKGFKITVLRGGAWTNNSSDARVTTRTPFPSTRSLKWLGFRCVKDK